MSFTYHRNVCLSGLFAMLKKQLSIVLLQADDDTTSQHLLSSEGVGASAFITRPDVSPRLQYNVHLFVIRDYFTHGVIKNLFDTGTCMRQGLTWHRDLTDSFDTILS